MNRQFLATTVTICSIVLLSGSWLTFGGDLNPPAGPVTGTMKPLNQVEPRIAINAENTPGDSDSLFRITQPGSYYLTGNVTGVSGKRGIEIAAAAHGPGVTIDLMGFELVGVPGSLDGIAVNSSSNSRNIAVRNGTIRAWGGDGVDLLDSNNNSLVGLRVSHNGGRGIHVGGANTITGCSAAYNTLEGIRSFGGVVANCSADFNSGDGITVFFSGSVTNCASNYNTGDGFVSDQACSFTNCTAYQNGAHGFDVSSWNTITNCTSTDNGLHGIEAGSGCTITACTTTINSGAGIFAGPRCLITNCTTDSNTDNGISVIGVGNRIVGNVCSANGSQGGRSGIRATGNNNRIEGNTVASNGFGIFLETTVTGNVVVGNQANGNGTNFVNPASGNFIGTLVGTNAAMNSSANSLINVSF